MEWLALLYEIFEVCIIPLLGVLTMYIVKFIQKKTEELNSKNENELMNDEDYSSFDCDVSKIGYIKSNGVKTVSKTTYESTYTIEDYILKDYKLITTSEYSVSTEQVTLETNRIDLSLPSINGYKDVTLEDNILWS